MFDLAASIGFGWNIDELMEMPLPLFYEWKAYAMENPHIFPAYTQARIDFDFGMLAANLFNLLTSLWAKNRTHYKPSDFMWKERPKPKSKTELYQTLRAGLLVYSGGKSANGKPDENQ